MGQNRVKGIVTLHFLALWERKSPPSEKTGGFLGLALITGWRPISAR